MGVGWHCAICACKPCICNWEEGDVECARNFPCEHCAPYNYYGEDVDSDPVVFAWHLHDYAPFEPLAWDINVPIQYWRERGRNEQADRIKILKGQLPEKIVWMAEGYRQFRRDHTEPGKLRDEAIKGWINILSIYEEEITALHNAECGCENLHRI